MVVVLVLAASLPQHAHHVPRGRATHVSMCAHLHVSRSLPHIPCSVRPSALPPSRRQHHTSPEPSIQPRFGRGVVRYGRQVFHAESDVRLLMSRRFPTVEPASPTVGNVMAFIVVSFAFLLPSVRRAAILAMQGRLCVRGGWGTKVPRKDGPKHKVKLGMLFSQSSECEGALDLFGKLGVLGFVGRNFGTPVAEPRMIDGVDDVDDGVGTELHSPSRVNPIQSSLVGLVGQWRGSGDSGEIAAVRRRSPAASAACRRAAKEASHGAARSKAQRLPPQPSCWLAHEVEPRRRLGARLPTMRIDLAPGLSTWLGGTR